MGAPGICWYNRQVHFDDVFKSTADLFFPAGDHRAGKAVILYVAFRSVNWPIEHVIKREEPPAGKSHVASLGARGYRGRVVAASMLD